jgi:hypothetical protein
MKYFKLEILSGLNTILPIVAYRSEAKDMLGDDWVQIHRRIVQQHANQYKRISWAKVNFFEFNFSCYLCGRHGFGKILVKIENGYIY